MLVTKLERHFLDLELMNALGILYFQFWIKPNLEFFVFLDLNVIKKNILN